jgi:RNA:NAD 2'-phosphotransferase (TPT1/KptA family)
MIVKIYLKFLRNRREGVHLRSKYSVERQNSRMRISSEYLLLVQAEDILLKAGVLAKNLWQ